MTLREKRCLFTKLLSELVLWVFAQGWEMAFDEVRVINPRHVRPLKGGPKFLATDAVHKTNSFHYHGLAADMNLYISGSYISNGEHPAWKEIRGKWRGMDPLCTEGSGWGDSNHLSLGEGK